LPIEVCALLAQRLAASALTQILALDIVACIAVCVVVMDVLLDGMPGAFTGHFTLHYTCADSQAPGLYSDSQCGKSSAHSLHQVWERHNSAFPI
jgi:hypothetical protein